MASTPSLPGTHSQQCQQCQQCRHCLHYYITHDPSFPYGCRALDFKGKRPPIHTVLAASTSNEVLFVTQFGDVLRRTGATGGPGSWTTTVPPLIMMS